MKSSNRMLRLAVMLAIATCQESLTASAPIFESGTMGSTGISQQDLGSTIPGTNIAPFSFAGSRFFVDEPVQVTAIGGHFVGGFGSNSFFGAIVKLTSVQDYPDSGDLSSPDVLGTTGLTFPEVSSEVFGELSVNLQPGWHAVVFGSGLFGATGRGGAVRNGVDNGSQSYFGWQSGGTGWFNLTNAWPDLPGLFDNHRFVVEGANVPEPTVGALLGTALTMLAIDRRRLKSFTVSLPPPV
jgi:hypothetical protein